ncbi:hypothetical protein Tco_0032060 [Tanacetum coccineum]
MNQPVTEVSTQGYLLRLEIAVLRVDERKPSTTTKAEKKPCGSLLMHLNHKLIAGIEKTSGQVILLVFTMRYGTPSSVHHKTHCVGGVRVAREDDRGVTEGREDVREVFQQCGNGAKRELSRCGRNQMGNEPILALPEGADNFVVYYDARNKDLEACLKKGEVNETWRVSIRIDVSNTLSIGRIEHEANMMDGCYLVSLIPRPSTIWERKMYMLYYGVGRRSEAKNEFEIDTRFRPPFGRDVRTLAIEEAYTTKYSIHPGADTMLCGFRLTNRWLSMKKDITSCGSKYLALFGSGSCSGLMERSSGLLLKLMLPEWEMERITKDIVVKLPI